MMKIYFEFGRKAVCLPSIPQRLLLRAGRTELRLLYALAADQSLAESFDERADALAEELKVSRSALDSALSFWIGAGVLSREGTEARPQEPQMAEEQTVAKVEKETVKRTKVTELPVYTSEEFTKVLERRGELAELIEESQRELGKVFNVTETQLLVSISEGLGLCDEYILSLLAYCKKIDKANLRYVEKMACSLYDKGITDANRLEEYLKEIDAAASAETQIRKMFGIGSRALTSKESKCINDWVNTFGFGIDMIKCAFEETVNNTTSPSVSYANKVLENWFSSGVKTPEDVKLHKEKRKASGAQSGAQAASFNVDDFFNAAINKGFGDEGQGG